MKASSMPLSSPSRAESFPPPLMRFLRSNNGSRSSRGRSRSGPIFYIRTRRNADITQEPSSPKVTCIGQVRSAQSVGTASNRHRRRRRRWLVKHALFCGSVPSRFYSQKRAFRRFFSKWFLFLRAGYCKKVDAEEDHFRVRNLVYCSKNCEDKIQESEKDFRDDCASPPRNGVILTRCRSAPYRCSSLGRRFWNSPLSENGEKNSEEFQKPRNEKGDKKSRISQENGEKFENSIKNNEDKLKGIVGHPLLLTRCKSEPARRGERLNPETSFRRL